METWRVSLPTSMPTALGSSRSSLGPVGVGLAGVGLADLGFVDLGFADFVDMGGSSTPAATVARTARAQTANRLPTDCQLTANRLPTGENAVPAPVGPVRRHKEQIYPAGS